MVGLTGLELINKSVDHGIAVPAYSRNYQGDFQLCVFTLNVYIAQSKQKTLNFAPDHAIHPTTTKV